MVHSSMLLPCVAVGEQDSAADARRLTTDAPQRATRLGVRRPPRCVAFAVIEADLEAISPGRAAAHDGHGRLAEGERAF